MQRTHGIALVAVLAAGVTLACGDAPDPVARLTAEPTEFELPHGTMVPLQLVWEMEEPLSGLEGSPIVLVHLLDDDGGVIRTFDHPFPGQWEPGERRVDEVDLYHSAVGPAEVPGSYRLTAGLYEGQRRWSLATDGERVDTGEYVVATVTVPPDGGEETPRIEFAGDWHEIEPGADRQVLARRWLAGEGTLAIDRVERPRSLSLVLRIPEARSEGALRLVLEPDAERPRLRLSSTCSGFEATLSASGPHQLAVPVPATEGRCAISFDANYTAVELTSLRELVVGVEQIGWRRGGEAEATAAATARSETSSREPPTRTEGSRRNGSEAR